MNVSFGSESAQIKKVERYPVSLMKVVLLRLIQIWKLIISKSRAILQSQLLIFTLNEMVSTIKQILQINYFYFSGKKKSKLKRFHFVRCVMFFYTVVGEGQVDDGAHSSNPMQQMIYFHLRLLSFSIYLHQFDFG